MCLGTPAVGLNLGGIGEDLSLMFKEQLGETKAISEKFVRRTIPKTNGSLSRLHIRVSWELFKILQYFNKMCRIKF